MKIFLSAMTPTPPDGFWWFGSGAVREGSHVDLGELQKLGFKDGRDARLQLIRCGERLTR